MNAPTTPRRATAQDPRPVVGACCVMIVAAILAAYSGSLGGTFLYDDIDSITGNASIRHFSTAFLPPDGATVSGRPFLNLTLALNYALSGTAVWSYHVLNLVIHAAAALALFGIARRAAGVGRLAVALGVALLWAVHPLQTESVAYVVQRGESLMGLLYLLTLYCFIRHAEGGGATTTWAFACVAACLLGMATKEVMVSAPVIVLLYDRTFLAGSFREAWRRRGRVYAALCACWVPLVLIAWRTGGRSGTAGFDSGVAWWAYLLSQLRAVGLYLRLSVWPHPLVGDYGRILGGSALEMGFGAVVVVSLLAGTVVLFRRNSPLGFLGAWFLIILSPSSSFVPVSTEIIAEHRMYLPLVAPVAVGVLALYKVLGGRRIFVTTIAVLAVVLGTLTFLRTRAYRSAEAFWSDVALKAPENPGPWNNLGIILAERGDQEGAIADYRHALRLAPSFAFAHSNLGNSLVATGHPADAAVEYEAALEFRPADPALHCSLGYALALGKRPLAAAAEFRTALKLDPARAEAWAGLGGAMVQAGNLGEAANAYSHAVTLRGDRAQTRAAYGDVLVQMGRPAEAELQYREALRLDPRDADVHNNLGSLLAQAGNLAGAEAEFAEAVGLRPDYGDAKANLGRVRALEHPGGTP
jgi:protein O-mannosyl-transferase